MTNLPMSSHKLLNTIDYIHTLTARSVPLVVKYKQYNQCAQADAVVIVLAVAKTDLQNSLSVSKPASQSVLWVIQKCLRVLTACIH
ncbi:hypothetical protein DPMN_154604 [Dreissena polymorpha]|uniref:Uncharacterized protein n=1 Tax=Dreissena polymorpha TaxID=45954 RepID=A0A9D4J5W0_DREPO|nr:hypothetical protein DPMN_154604 [Dreissena polymorpha]